MSRVFVIVTFLVGFASTASAQEFPEDGMLLRFEEGVGDDIVDDVSGDTIGFFQGGGVYANGPPLASGAPNDFCADFTTGNWGLIEVPFGLHDPDFGGAPGDATLEFLMNVPAPFDHRAWIWSNADDNNDANRFNCFFNATFLGLPDSERFVSGDYRAEDGTIARTRSLTASGISGQSFARTSVVASGSGSGTSTAS